MKSKYELISFILRSDRRRDILESLAQSNRTAAELTRITGMYKSHVSRAVKELEQERLIECLNPYDRSYKFYKITKKGKILLRYKHS